MNTPAQESAFRTRTSAETKADTTSRAAKEIIENEVNARRTKTEKLRQARLKKEADESNGAPLEAKPSRPARKVKTSRSARKAGG